MNKYLDSEGLSYFWGKIKSLFSNLASVATSGDYNDLTNKPTIPTVPVQDVTVGGTSVLSNGVAVVPAIPDVSGKADKTLVASSMPSEGFLPNVVYNLGEIRTDTTFLLSRFTDNTIANIFCWTFSTGTTAPTIRWPSEITGWSGGSTPTINASKSYEVSVMDGLATIIES